MNIFLYVILFIIFSPKFFLLLAGKSSAPVKLGEILLNAFLFVLAVYVAEYLTHRFHILENYEDAARKQSIFSFLRDLIGAPPEPDYISPSPSSTFNNDVTQQTSSR